MIALVGLSLLLKKHLDGVQTQCSQINMKGYDMYTIITTCPPSKKLLDFAKKHGFKIVSVIDFVDERTFAKQNSERHIYKLENRKHDYQEPIKEQTHFYSKRTPHQEWRSMDKRKYR